MPYHLKMSYSHIADIDPKNFDNKSILIIGAGYITNQYAYALSEMGIKDVTIISNTQETSFKICNQYGFKSLFGGYKNTLPDLPKMDLVIVTTPVSILLPAAKCALENGQTNILIEKPGSLYFKDLLFLSKKFPNSNIRIAYNRLQYPNFHLLKKLSSTDGGITSCTFTFTEWLNRIDFTKYPTSILERWGIANSLHVISMAFELIGLPKNLTSYQFGSLDWHPAGSIFVGSGISKKNIPFSYHADWNSSGRWGIEIMTKNNAYRLMPLEELYMCKKGSTSWENISFKNSFPDIKFGIAEQIILMLENKSLCNQLMVSLEKASMYIETAEKIFGYKNIK
jgi:predicted dehydrogenase